MRTFIAIELPTPIREAVRLRQQQLRAALKEAGLEGCFRWSAMDNIHVTLRFLGETDRGQTERIAAGLAEIARRRQGFSLCVGGMGCFPNFRRPNVLWLGVDGQMEALQAMQAAVEELVVAAGFEAETREFSPHLTLARAQRERSRAELQRAGELLQRLAAQNEVKAQSGSTPCFPVAEVVHMHSDLRPAGPIYTPLSVHPLMGD
jgi:2'-5' RNA ligase